jgi:hypothetical protein
MICVQETHRDKNNIHQRDMKLIIERPHEKYGSLIFVRDNLKILSTSRTEINDIEIHTIELTNCTVTSIYKPPNVPFKFTKPTNFENQRIKITIGDFNSHNSMGLQRNK